MYLAADVGGTKTILALFRRAKGRLREVRSTIYASGEASSFEGMVRAFLAEGREKPRRFAAGVAGPIVEGRSQIVNLRWPIDTARVRRALGIPVAILNDVEAAGWGLNELTPRQVVNLTPRLKPVEGNAALIAPGTGLGMGLLFWHGGHLHPSASEGGHQDFAPRNEVECDLLLWLKGRFPRVSLERVVAGPGFSAVYDFLVETGRGVRSPLMQARLASGDRNAAVSVAGVAGEDATAEAAVELWVSLLGAAAGDLALIVKASAGVWVAGGIPPKILPKLREGTFMEAFRDKGRLTPFVSRVPVRVVVEPRLGLLGAAHFAARGTDR